MSDKILREIRTTVGRGCGFTALILGGLMMGLAGRPIADPVLALKAGAAGALVAALALWSEAVRPCADPQAGSVRSSLLRRYAWRFACLSAACALVEIAGQVNRLLYPL
jgi:hypothetical protein